MLLVSFNQKNKMLTGFLGWWSDVILTADNNLNTYGHKNTEAV
jgi:hypothetical protein